MSNNQTDTFSLITLGKDLPFQISLQEYGQEFTGGLPTLQAFESAATDDGGFLLLSGRTAGLHGFSTDPNNTGNFPPTSYSRDAWVLDAKTHQSWSRPLDQLTNEGVSSNVFQPLISTGVASYQSAGKLYLAGGYRYDASSATYTTSDQLTAIDIDSFADWVKGGALAPGTIKQTQDPLLRVAGGEMFSSGGKTHLVFGFDYQGSYVPTRNGDYTQQVRSFEIVEEPNQLRLEHISQTEPQSAFRRRDLNMVPVVEKNTTTGILEQKQVVLSGVFTEQGGAWTVPVEIDAQGNPSMADPEVPSTFKQGMNNYDTANVGLFSQQSGEMHTLLFGGISGQYYNPASQEFVTDANLPFINQATDVILNSERNYRQELLLSPDSSSLPLEYPQILQSNGNPLLFGASSRFLLAPGIETYDNGVIALDKLTSSTTIGYIFGGIAAEQPNFGASTASGQVFNVQYSPVSVPEPSLNGSLLPLAVMGVYLVLRHQKRK